MIRSAMVELGDAPLEIIDGDRGKNYQNKTNFRIQDTVYF